MAVNQVDWQDVMTPSQFDEIVKGVIQILAWKHGLVGIEAKEGQICFIHVTQSKDVRSKHDLQTLAKDEIIG